MKSVSGGMELDATKGKSFVCEKIKITLSVATTALRALGGGGLWGRVKCLSQC